MSLQPDDRLSHYRIVEKIGEGGMGVVWRATDTSLNRDVAIKVLPSSWSTDPDRLQRFEREARLLASLNHPNVATVHGLHEADTSTGPVRFIAMEWVPGEDLATRIGRGPLGVEQSLQTACRIAEALEAAHAAGVVHRDLKPANIRVTPAGKIKVLDFGLAKSSVAEPGGDPELSPTLTAAGTQAGVVLGTAAYMSPEQARGHVVDRRADIWAFGVVLYEMLTGVGAFRGDSIADTMASVLKLDPDFRRLPADTPRAVRRVLGRCLQKSPDRRLHDIADARIELEEMDLDAAVEAEGAPVGDPADPSRRSGVLPLLIATVLGLAAGALLWAWFGDGGPPAGATEARRVHRSVIPLPEGKSLTWSNSIALSPDGSMLAVSAGHDQPSLYLRRLDSMEMEKISGTDGAMGPFFSPDGEELGFLGGGQLKKVSLRGGAREVTVLCDAQAGYRGTWNSSGWIYFTYGESRLARVRETGGDVEDLGDAGDVFDMHALPKEAGVLLTVHATDRQSTRKDTAKIQVLSPDDLTVKPVLEGGYNARYLPTGHLVFMRSGGLFAVPFDLERLEVTLPAVSVQPDVWTDSIWSIAHYTTSSDGTLVYVSDGDVARTVPTWVDLSTGEEEQLPVPPGLYNTFDLSPDGTKLAIQDLSGAQDQIWIYDLPRDSFTRLTLEGASFYPAWSHDGRDVFFASNRDGKVRLFRQPVDGSVPASRLLTDEQEAMMETDVRWPSSATPDGKYLVIYTWGHPQRGGDLWKVPLDASSDPEVLLATEYNEIIPQVSPDGKWLAFLSDQKGTYEIMVRPFDDMRRREWSASGGVGNDPRWTPDGDALLFWRGQRGLMRVPVTTGDDFTAGIPTRLLEIDYHDAAGSSMAISPDGKRVLIQKPVEVALRDGKPMILVTGWADEVARRVDANR